VGNRWLMARSSAATERQVSEKDIPKFRTDQDGIAAIPILKSGAHLLAIDHRVTPSQTPELAATDLYNATLWFSVKQNGNLH
jgi:hypothetical protein